MTREPRPHPTFGEATRVWGKIGLISFGGPAGQIALMHRVLVEEQRWISEARFLHALNYCMLLPGPEAQQLATYIGWLLHRTPGGLVAGTLFVLPGFAVIVALSAIYALFQGTPLVDGLFFGLKAAVLAIVIEAVIRVARRALRNSMMYALAALSFLAIWAFQVPFPLIVMGAGVVGLVGSRVAPQRFAVMAPKGSGDAITDLLLDAGMADHLRPSLGRAVRTATLGLLVWLGPVAALWLTLGPNDVFTSLAVFFSKMAVVTFGGAYAVLAWVAQAAVGDFGWLKPGEMVDGLAMAETTPGPLIMVLTYVGFLAGFRAPGAMPPMLGGLVGAAVTTWVTFAPCFLWIFLGGPYVEKLRGDRTLSAALSTITAAVVGVILNLAVWFALHVLFRTVNEAHLGPLRLALPDLASIDPAALILAITACLALLRFHRSVVEVLALPAVLGLAWRLVAG